MNVQADLSISGRCEQALAFCKQSIGAVVKELMRCQFGVPWMVNVAASKA